MICDICQKGFEPKFDGDFACPGCWGVAEQKLMKGKLTEAKAGRVKLERADLVYIRRESVPLNIGDCVYFLWKEERIVYIGQSGKPAARIGQHVAYGEKEFDAVSVVEVNRGNLNYSENYYIQKFRPVYNRGGVPGEGLVEEYGNQLMAEADVVLHADKDNPDILSFAKANYPKTLGKREKLSTG